MDEWCYVAWDTETTGLDTTRDNIVSISARELVGPAEFHAYVNPLRPIPPPATQIHAIFNGTVLGLETWAEVADKFWKWLTDLARGRRIALIAHNAPYDVTIMRYENDRANFAPPVDFYSIDTLPIFQRLRREGAIQTASAKLRDLAQGLLGEAMPEAHDSLPATRWRSRASASCRTCRRSSFRAGYRRHKCPRRRPRACRRPNSSR